MVHRVLVVCDENTHHHLIVERGWLREVSEDGADPGDFIDREDWTIDQFGLS